MKWIYWWFLSTWIPALALGAHNACANKIAPPRDFSGWINQTTDDIPRRHLGRTNTKLPVLVVGAGPAGLAAMYWLDKKRVAYEAFEGASDVGGVWNRRNAESVAYDDLITNSSRATTYLDIPFPAEPGWKDYIPYASAQRYLQSFASRNQLREKIHFNRRVRKIERTLQGTWRASYYDADTKKFEDREFRAVINAAGFHTASNAVYPADLWDAAMAQGIHPMHTASFRNADDMAGETVLVLGFGNSAAEVATIVQKKAAKTIISVRTMPYLSPLYIGWIPADAFATTPSGLSHENEMRLFRLLHRLITGFPGARQGEAFGKPDFDILDRLPVSDRGIAKLIRQRKVQLRSNLRALQGGFAVYEDGEAPEKIDRIIFGTGYRRHFDFIPSEYGNLEDPNFNLSLLLFHPDQPGLCHLPELTVPQGAWPLFMDQAQAVAAYFAAENLGVGTVDSFNSYLRRSANPNLKGDLFGAANGFHVDPHLASPFYRDFARWILDEH